MIDIDILRDILGDHPLCSVQRAELEKAITALESPRDWTPCSEGTNLPRFGETVLVTVEFESGSRIVLQAYRKWTIFQSWFWVYSNDNRCWQKVIAWKRQEPYNPDRKEDAKSDDVSQWPEWKQRAALSNYDFKKEDSE